MSSKKFVYLLMMVAIVCGVIASDVAHGQSKDLINFEGTVSKSDGTSVAGLVLKAVRIDHGTEGQFFVQEITLGADGAYKFSFVAFPFSTPPAPSIAAGEQFEFSVADGGVVVHSERYIVTATDLAAASPLGDAQYPHCRY